MSTYQNGQNNPSNPAQIVYHIDTIRVDSGAATFGQSFGNTIIHHGSPAVLPQPVGPVPLPGESKPDSDNPSTVNGGQLLQSFRNSGKDTRQFLRRSRPYLAQNTDSKVFMNQLYAIECITDIQLQEANSKLDYDCNNFLYDIISRKDAMAKCIIALEESENHTIISHLLKNSS